MAAIQCNESDCRGKATRRTRQTTGLAPAAFGAAAKERVDDLLGALKNDPSGGVQGTATLGETGADSERVIEQDKRVGWAAADALERFSH
jgi:hypothetical protein